MKNYVIVTDSSCDLPAEIVSEYGIKVLPLDVTIEGEATIPNDQVDNKEFYQKLRSGKTATTSAVNIERFNEFFENQIGEGYDILYIAMSSALSRTYNSAVVAAGDLNLKYPDNKIYIIDTLSASMGQGLLIYLAANMKKKGESIEAVRDYTENLKLKLCHWFTLDDLFFLKRGGRISSTSAVLGSMLSIKPILHVDNEGRLIMFGKSRGRKSSIEDLYHHMEKTVINPSEQIVFISHGDCVEDAQALAEIIKNKMNVKEVVISYVGAVIGAHSGPGTLALFYIGTER